MRMRDLIDIVEGRNLSRTNFDRWFAGSVVVDDAGKPLVVYHGTNQPFERFSADRRGMHTQSSSSKMGYYFTDHPEVASNYATYAARKLVHDIDAHEKKVEAFQRDIAAAERAGDWDRYEKLVSAYEDFDLGAIYGEPEGESLYPVYLRITNPLVVDNAQAVYVPDVVAQARADGHDGVILRDIVDSPSGGIPSTHYAVFSPDQVKSIYAREFTDSDHLSEGRAFRTGSFKDFAAEVRTNAMNYFGADAHEIDEVDVREFLDNHQKLFSRKRATIWRVMKLDAAQIEALQAGDRLGQHWSYEFRAENIEGFDVRRAEEVYVFEATVSARDIDLGLTVAYNCYFPHEAEVFVTGNPVLVSIRRYSYRGGLDDENLRPDLVGAVMSA